MKYFIAVAAVALLAINAWLVCHQTRLERELRTVQAENQRLAEEAAQRPALSAEDFRAAQARLDQAHAFMDAVESRLTNATAVLGSLQEAAKAQRQAALAQSGPRRPRPAGIVSDGAFTAETTGLEWTERSDSSLVGPLSSSHSPDGQLLSRSWGPEQVVGPPNTHAAGDIPTAWAPRSSSGTGEEWLHVNYDRAVDVSEINVRETHNPGAISKVAAVLPDGREVIVWEGTEPAAPPQTPVDRNFTVPSGIQAQSVKVYLDRRRVPGWNEIDAVELVGRDGSRQWASSASASSSFAEPNRAPLGFR